MNHWILAARPKTLAAAYTPVLIGISIAYLLGFSHWFISFMALLCATLIQIGTNFANDYYDFKKGSDRDDRIGFTRMVAAGNISAQHMLNATMVCMSLAFVLGLYLVYIAGWQILAIGVSSILFGILYTGGPYPLGYNGLGDIFVFIYFGIVATMATVFVHTLSWEPIAFWASLIPGALSTNILVINNLRDIEQDRISGKKTLGVLFGEYALKWEYTLLLLLAYAIPPHFYVHFDATLFIFLPFISFPIALGLLKSVWLHEEKKLLNRTLEKTAAFMFVFGVLFIVGLLIK
jgi:1,4-dihydroxy-2-naphthoate octaprenyltransferase